MGDHRASITIKFSFHGKEYDHEWWINWHPNDDGCDQRIVDWFRECADDGYARFSEANFAYERQMKLEQEEAMERAEYERLKAKFEQPMPTPRKEG